jgi:hypothetical protein
MNWRTLSGTLGLGRWFVCIVIAVSVSSRHALAWSGQKRVNFAFGIQTKSGNLSRIIDRRGVEQIPARVCRNERVHIGYDVVLPVDCGDVSQVIDRETRNLATVVCIASAGTGESVPSLR